MQQGVNASHLPGAGLLLNTVGSRLTEPEKVNSPVCSHAPGLVERSRFAAQLECPLGVDAQGAKQTQLAARALFALSLFSSFEGRYTRVKVIIRAFSSEVGTSLKAFFSSFSQNEAMQHDNSVALPDRCRLQLVRVFAALPSVLPGTGWNGQELEAVKKVLNLQGMSKSAASSGLQRFTYSRATLLHVIFDH